MLDRFYCISLDATNQWRESIEAEHEKLVANTPPNEQLSKKFEQLLYQQLASEQIFAEHRYYVLKRLLIQGSAAIYSFCLAFVSATMLIVVPIDQLIELIDTHKVVATVLYTISISLLIHYVYAKERFVHNIEDYKHYVNYTRLNG